MFTDSTTVEIGDSSNTLPSATDSILPWWQHIRPLIPSRLRADFNSSALCIFRAIWRKTNKHIFKDKSSTSTTKEVAEMLKNNLKGWKTADLHGIARVIILYHNCNRVRRVD
jgi:hypothetical protein